MHRLIRVVAPMFAVLALLHGCGKAPECPETATIMPDITSEAPAGEEFHDCTHAQRGDGLQHTWCEAKQQFELSSLSGNPDAFKGYIKGYREGLNHARQAKESRMALISVEGKGDSPENAGYRSGYNKVLKDLGIMEFDCTSSDNASEYKDRWCEAADTYRTTGLAGDNNLFIKGRFIDGYMAGGRVALTVPTSMEAFFSGDNPEGKQPAIVQPEGDLKGTELAFYRGFDEGYKAMIASIRESINQVMQQMQIPNNMELPEGMMPPQPGQ